jgi:predicted N-acetyltransferase YhbS
MTPLSRPQSASISRPATDLDPPILSAEQPEDAVAVDALIAAAFGPGRLAKTAERLRETNTPLLDLCVVAHARGAVVGCARMWPIRIGARDAVFLGPFAVDAAWRGEGLGAAMITQACDAAKAAGHDLILLVGDQPYFGPLGFSMVPRGRIAMPGPVDPRRVLARALTPGALEGLEGDVTA